MREWVTKERGDITVSPFLIFMLFVIMVGVVKTVHAVTINDVTLNKVVAMAARAAANQYYLTGTAEGTEESGETGEISEAKGTPIINAYNAREAFERILQSNLKLNGYLEPENNSPLEGQIRYTLFICTGGGMDNVLYEFVDGRLTLETIPSDSLPQSFIIDGQPVTFVEPGVFCILEGTPKPIFGKAKSVKRSAIASLKFIHDQWVATNS